MPIVYVFDPAVSQALLSAGYVGWRGVLADKEAVCYVASGDLKKRLEQYKPDTYLFFACAIFEIGGS